VAKSDLGTKLICPTTGKKFYDLNKKPGDLTLHRRGRRDRADPAAPDPALTLQRAPEPQPPLPKQRRSPSRLKS